MGLSLVTRIGFDRRSPGARRPAPSLHEQWKQRQRRERLRERLPRVLVTALLVAAAFLLGLAWNAPVAWGQSAPGSGPGQADPETARFARCGAAARVTCVVDGDTFWYRGARIRVADINTPETTRPACPREAALGEAASQRLAELLNQGPFTLAPSSRDRDRYGRLLRTVTRHGESLGAALVREGLAEEWRGYRGSWC